MILSKILKRQVEIFKDLEYLQSLKLERIETKKTKEDIANLIKDLNKEYDILENLKSLNNEHNRATEEKADYFINSQFQNFKYKQSNKK